MNEEGGGGGGGVLHLVARFIRLIELVAWFTIPVHVPRVNFYPVCENMYIIQWTWKQSNDVIVFYFLATTIHFALVLNVKKEIVLLFNTFNCTAIIFFAGAAFTFGQDQAMSTKFGAQLPTGQNQLSWESSAQSAITVISLEIRLSSVNFQYYTGAGCKKRAVNAAEISLLGPLEVLSDPILEVAGPLFKT
ncbi:hypothetical protein ACJX0J_011091, partial [Zea mays]